MLNARVLSNDQKIEMLLRWENAALHEDAAVEEGIRDGDSDLVRRILVALGTLNAPVDVEHTGPSKQHGVTLRPQAHGGIRTVPALREMSLQYQPATQKGDKVMVHNLELSEQNRRECAAALSKVLADTFLLYLKTHNFHWNVEGPQFLALHAEFEEQYRDLWNSVDDIAERIRALGQPAPGTAAKLKELSEIKVNPGIPPPADMLRELMRDHSTAARTVRAALSTVQAAGDDAAPVFPALADNRPTSSLRRIKAWRADCWNYA